MWCSHFLHRLSLLVDIIEIAAYSWKVFSWKHCGHVTFIGLIEGMPNAAPQPGQLIAWLTCCLLCDASGLGSYSKRWFDWGEIFVLIGSWEFPAWWLCCWLWDWFGSIPITWLALSPYLLPIFVACRFSSYPEILIRRSYSSGEMMVMLLAHQKTL